jgi:hypothetical protein
MPLQNDKDGVASFERKIADLIAEDRKVIDAAKELLEKRANRLGVKIIKSVRDPLVGE